MEFIIIWLSSILGSKIIEFFNSLHIYNKLAQSGYYINVSKMLKANSNANDSFRKIIPYIPIINIVLASVNYLHTIMDMDSVFFSLKNDDCLERLSIEEEKEYKEKPRGLTAYKIAIKKDTLMRNAKKLIIPGMNGQKDSIIYYAVGPNFSINIIKVEGPMIMLKKEEQQLIVENYIFESFDSICSKLFGTFDDEVDIPEDDANLSKRRRIINELKRLRNELVNSKEEEKVYKKK